MAGLLCLIAHPDDEIFCAGLLARLTRRDIPIRLACLTRGEGGVLGSLPRSTRETIGAVREQEMMCSARALGARSLDFLDYVDPVPSDGLRAPEHCTEELIHEIETLIGQYTPHIVLTHGSNGDYGHPAHVLLHDTVRSALARIGQNAPRMYTFNAFHPSLPHPGLLNENDWADLILDVSSVLYVKQAVLQCHTTQWEVFVDRQDTLSDYESAIEEYVRTFSKESYCCHGPVAQHETQDLLVAWLGLEKRPFMHRAGLAIQETALRSRHRMLRTLKTIARTVRNRLRAFKSTLVDHSNNVDPRTG